MLSLSQITEPSSVGFPSRTLSFFPKFEVNEVVFGLLCRAWFDMSHADVGVRTVRRLGRICKGGNHSKLKRIVLDSN
jgi:hypothetical protein